jgi:hypothetical protein
MTDEPDMPKEIDGSIEDHPDVQKLIAAIPAKKPIDPKFKQEIESGTTEKKMKALEIIERHHNEISGFFLLNTLEKLQKDPDETVRIKATNLSEEKFGNMSKVISKQFLDLGKIYGGTFSKLAADLAITSTAFTQMHDIAKITRKSLDIPIYAIDLGINWDLVNSQANIFKNFQGLQIQLPEFSPILTTTEIVAPIFDRNNQQLTIPEALGKSVSEVENELDAAISSNTDVIFNFEGYPFLYNLERLIRDLVRVRICEKYRMRLTEKIPLDILNEWEKRRDTEKENPFVEGDYDLIEYSDFNHLKIIIEKRSNKKDFLDIFNDQELTGIITKLNELDPIRKKIAHSRSLTETEFTRLKMYAEDIVRIMQK